MKHLFVFSCAAMLLFASCKKDSSSSAPTGTGTGTGTGTTSPYYFKFTLNGTNNDYNINFPQYMSFYTDLAGGYQPGSATLFPSISLAFEWLKKDTIQESDLTGLIGQTIYFNDTVIQPQIGYSLTDTSADWDSIDTANTAFNVKVTNVTFLKNDTTLGIPVKAYVITGTCSAFLSNGTSSGVLSNGQFNFVITRTNY